MSGTRSAILDLLVAVKISEFITLGKVMIIFSRVDFVNFIIISNASHPGTGKII